jgi:hypothetical protein
MGVERKARNGVDKQLYHPVPFRALSLHVLQSMHGLVDLHSPHCTLVVTCRCGRRSDIGQKFVDRPLFFWADFDIDDIIGAAEGGGRSGGWGDTHTRWFRRTGNFSDPIEVVQ